MHISLDGFVAGPNGEMNWIKVDEELFDHIGKRISESDMALYGRVTYEMMENYWPTAGEEPGSKQARQRTFAVVQKSAQSCFVNHHERRSFEKYNHHQRQPPRQAQ